MLTYRSNPRRARSWGRVPAHGALRPCRERAPANRRAGAVNTLKHLVTDTMVTDTTEETNEHHGFNNRLGNARPWLELVPYLLPSLIM